MGTLRPTYATAPRRGPLPKLIWADLFSKISEVSTHVPATTHVMALSRQTTNCRNAFYPELE